MAEDPAPQLVEEYGRKGLLIEQWGAAELGCAEDSCGGKGSPTKVKKIESVRLRSTEHKVVEPTDQEINGLMRALMVEHIFD